MLARSLLDAIVFIGAVTLRPVKALLSKYIC